eukprot:5138184-Amphidinium_carterae.1
MESKAKRLGSKVARLRLRVRINCRDKYTPAPYRQSLQQIVRKQPDVTLTVDNTPDLCSMMSFRNQDRLGPCH